MLVVFYRKDKILSGASAGAGFGFIEATFLLGSVASFSIIAIVERLFAIIFHISSTSLIMYGATRKKFFLYYLIISLVHTVGDTIAVMYQMHRISLVPTEVFVAIVASILFIISIYLHKKRLRTTII
ncbi:MAG: YhfC family glutamic-type intramembrane protease [Caldisericota bacterium]|nr:YhfC family glutamic-type intramembrane protease [Caldisericota bacterium]